MNPGVWNDILTEMALSLNYVIIVFLLQIAILFGKHWYDDKKKQISNKIILSYALYFLFFTVGVGIAFYISSLLYISFPGGNPFALYGEYMVLSIVIRGIGGVLFAFLLELKILKQTKFLISFTLLALIIITPFLLGTPIISNVANFMNLILVGLPFVFTIYFLRKTYGNVRQKLLIGLFGFFLIGGALALSTYNADQLLQSLLLSYSGFVIFPSKILVIFGAMLVLYGFRGYSFFLEAEWKQNLITLYVIDKTQKSELYSKNFVEGGVLQLGVFAGGMAGLVQIIDEFMTSESGSQMKEEVDIINLGNIFLLLTSGKKVITALIVKKNIQHAHYFLKTVTSKFEIFFWDILDSQDYLKEKEVFKPTEMIIQDIIKP